MSEHWDDHMEVWLQEFSNPNPSVPKHGWITTPFRFEHHGTSYSGATDGRMMVLLRTDQKAHFNTLDEKDLEWVRAFVNKQVYNSVESTEYQKLLDFCGEPSDLVNCDVCSGSGKIECPDCKGYGRVLATCNDCGDLHLCEECECDKGESACPDCNEGKVKLRRFAHILNQRYDINKLSEAITHLRADSVVLMDSKDIGGLCIDGPWWRVHIMPVTDSTDNDDPVWGEDRVRKGRSLDLKN